MNISYRGIQLLSTSTYLPLAKLSRLYYIGRYSRFTRFTPLMTHQLSCRSPQNTPKVQRKGTTRSLKTHTLFFPGTSFIFLVGIYLLLSPARVMQPCFLDTDKNKGRSSVNTRWHHRKTWCHHGKNMVPPWWNFQMFKTTQLWSLDQGPTTNDQQPATEELKYNRDRARWRQRATNNMF